MRIEVSGKDLAELSADIAVCFAYEGDGQPCDVSDRELKRQFAQWIRAENFKGNRGDLLVWNPNGHYRVRRFLLVGLGPKGRNPGEAIRLGCARAARSAAGFSAKSLVVRLPLASPDRALPEARAAAEGAMLGAYTFDRYLNDPTRRAVHLESVVLSTSGAIAAVKRAVEQGEVAARGVYLARDLGNEPPSTLTPPVLARLAVQKAKAAGLGSKVLGPVQLKSLGMNAVLAVGRGSEEPPQVVHLVYRPPGKRAGQGGKSKIVVLGKGVTFDSGGLNLKPSEYMLHMKSDMAGAAAVLGMMTALPKTGCRTEVHALLGLVENMTGPAAYKPGDVIKTYSGKTVEVGNTDAEGRLVLADLLAYAAATLAPTHLVDVATLTGACVVALGPRVAGLFTRNEELRDALLRAGAESGEKIWQLPLHDEYLELLQKGPADLCSVGGRWGGAITAALFLGEFLPRELPWAHLDIAGPAFSDRDLPESPAGATGAGVLLLLRWLEKLGNV